jgi:hypothetical protein
MARDYISIDQVINALRQFPKGATSRQLAERLGMKPHSVGTRLYKQHIYGRGVARTESAGPQHEYIWRAE